MDNIKELKILKEKSNDLKLFFKRLKLEASIIATVMFLYIAPNVCGDMSSRLDNKEEIQLYDETIDDLKELLEKNGITSIDDIHTNFISLLYGGYLSLNHNFKYNSPKCELADDNLASSCIEGNGVCKNIASMLRDLYEAYDYDSFVLSGLVNTNEELDSIDKLLGNHLITVVSDDNNNHYYDPTNKQNLALIEKEELAFADDYDTIIQIRYFASVIAYKFKNNISDILKVMNDEPNQSYVEPISYNNSISYEEMENFYQEHKEIYETIVNKMFENNEIVFELNNIHLTKKQLITNITHIPFTLLVIAYWTNYYKKSCNKKLLKKTRK